MGLPSPIWGVEAIDGCGNSNDFLANVHPEVWGFMIQCDEHIIQMGNSTHQLEDWFYCYNFWLETFAAILLTRIQSKVQLDNDLEMTYIYISLDIHPNTSWGSVFGPQKRYLRHQTSGGLWMYRVYRYIYLGGGFDLFLLFSPLFGEDSHLD